MWLEPGELARLVSSIGVNYLLHCLPGTMIRTSAYFANLNRGCDRRSVVWRDHSGSGVETMGFWPES